MQIMAAAAQREDSDDTEEQAYDPQFDESDVDDFIRDQCQTGATGEDSNQSSGAVERQRAKTAEELGELHYDMGPTILCFSIECIVV